jgi:hypothetical protein
MLKRSRGMPGEEVTDFLVQYVFKQHDKYLLDEANEDQIRILERICRATGRSFEAIETEAVRDFVESV